MTRTLVTVAVVALVVLAGCGSAPATQTQNPGGSPGEQTTDATPSGDTDRVTIPNSLVPPGASQTALTNPQAVVQGHVRTLNGKEAASTTTYRNIGRNRSGVVEYNLTSTPFSFVSNRQVVGNGTPTSESVFLDNGTVYVRQITGSDTAYKYSRGPTRTIQQYRRADRPVAQMFQFYAGLAERMHATDFATINGEKTVRFEATSANVTRFNQVKGILGMPNATLDGVHVTAYVDSNGVIHDFEATMNVTLGNGTSTTYHADHRLQAYGDVDVESPSWATSVPTVNATFAENDTLLVLENTGSEPLANFSIGVDGNVTADVNVNETFEPGETAYAYVTTSGPNATLHVNETRPTVPADAETLPQEFSGQTKLLRVYLGTRTVAISLGVLEEISANSTATTAVTTTPGGTPGLESTRAPSIPATSSGGPTAMLTHR